MSLVKAVCFCFCFAVGAVSLSPRLRMTSVSFAPFFFLFFFHRVLRLQMDAVEREHEVQIDTRDALRCACRDEACGWWHSAL